MTTEEMKLRELKSQLDLAWQQVNHFTKELQLAGYDVTIFGPVGQLCIQTEKPAVKAIKTIEVTL